ncbi:acetylcholine receptor subunit alpha-like [Amphiura filiformis]|uniref:acetylcholine receptor subunit alpha-like n=1 Tax=Amphiura filiformis TaxID=82378 RepID=UPI003B21EE5E
MECLRKLQVFACCFLLINIYVLVGAQSNESYQHKYEWQTKLHDDLLKNYNKAVPPSVNGPEGPAVNVNLRFGLAYFEFIDHSTEVATIHGYFRQTWNDARLSWDPASHNGTKSMKIAASDLWLPDIEMNNAGTIVQNFDTDVQVFSDGRMNRAPNVEITLICKMDFKFFPFDEQVCELLFGSWHYTGDVLNLTQSTDVVDLLYYKQSGSFEITDSSAVRREVKYPCCPESFIDITYTLYLKRVSGAYSVKLVIPAALSGFLILATFLLPPASCEKITLCGLIFVALLLQLIYLHDIVPASGDTILGDYFAFALFIDFFATIIAVVSYHVHGGSPMTQQSSAIEMKQMDAQSEDGTLGKKLLKDGKKREYLRYMDFVCFVIFGIILVIGMGIILGLRY